MTALVTPAPNATRAAGELVSVDAAALRDVSALGRTMPHYANVHLRALDGAIATLIATAAPLPPAVVDAGTLAQWRNDADRLDKSAGRSDSVIVSGDCRSGAFALRAACDALAAAAQPARAVPSRGAVETYATRDQVFDALAVYEDAAFACGDWRSDHDGDMSYDALSDALTDARDSVNHAIYGDAPADASEAVRDV